MAHLAAPFASLEPVGRGRLGRWGAGFLGFGGLGV